MSPPSAPIALITGANRGLGEAVAHELARREYRVLVGARELAAGQRVADAIVRAGGAAEAVALDVTDPAPREALAARLAATGERLDALVNNAGLYEGDPAAVLAVNFEGPWALTERLLPHLAPGARVVMVSSGLGSLSGFPATLARRLDPPPALPALRALVDEYLDAARAGGGGGHGWPSAYSVSKAALNVLARDLAALLGERARVNAVSPGWVRTRMGGPGAPRAIEQGRAGLVWAAMLPADGPTGGFFEDGRPIPW